MALQLEERDLLNEHGVSYQSYRERVPMLVPGLSSLRRDGPSRMPEMPKAES